MKRQQQASLSEDSNYQEFIARSRIGDPIYDAYIHFLAARMKEYDTMNPYQKGALTQLTEAADSFLKSNSPITWEQFLAQSHPENFTKNDFGRLPNVKKVKRRLFEYRALLYLSALQDTYKSGANIPQLTRMIQERTIPYIKKEKEEPTFEEIMKVLNAS